MNVTVLRARQLDRGQVRRRRVPGDGERHDPPHQRQEHRLGDRRLRAGLLRAPRLRCGRTGDGNARPAIAPSTRSGKWSLTRGALRAQTPRVRENLPRVAVAAERRDAKDVPHHRLHILGANELAVLVGGSIRAMPWRARSAAPSAKEKDAATFLRARTSRRAACAERLQASGRRRRSSGSPGLDAHRGAPAHGRHPTTSRGEDLRPHTRSELEGETRGAITCGRRRRVGFDGDGGTPRRGARRETSGWAHHRGQRLRRARALTRASSGARGATAIAAMPAPSEWPVNTSRTPCALVRRPADGRDRPGRPRASSAAARSTRRLTRELGDDLAVVDVLPAS